MTPITDIELDDLTHTMADEIEKYTDGPIDRVLLNDKLTALLAEYGIENVE